MNEQCPSCGQFDRHRPGCPEAKPRPRRGKKITTAERREVNLKYTMRELQAINLAITKMLSREIEGEGVSDWARQIDADRLRLHLQSAQEKILLQMKKQN